MTLGWIQLGRGVWSFLCVVGFGLLIFCWKNLHLYSSKILASNFLFWWYLCLVLVSGWWWLHRMTLGVFPPLQSFLRVWEGSVQVLLCMLGEIFQWSHLVLDFCWHGIVFFKNYRFVTVFLLQKFLLFY